MWGRGSQLGSGEMAKHKPYKFACSTLRLEGPALRKCNTKHAKPSKQGELTKSRRSKPKPRTIESLIGGKQKQALQRMKTKHGNTPAQSRPPMRRPHPCIVSFLFVAFRAAQSTHSQCLSDCFSLNTLIEHRYQSSKHGTNRTIKHDKPKQHKIIRRPNLQISIEISF